MDVDVKSLTDEQRQLAGENHNLIYKFASLNSISIDEFYGILAEGLCKAAKHYDKSKGRFTTFAFACMRNEYLCQWNKQHRKSQIPERIVLSYDELYDGAIYATDEGASEEFLDCRCYDDVLCSMMLDALKECLTRREVRIVSWLVEGYCRAEIADKMQCSTQNVSYCIKRIRDKAEHLF